MKKRSAITIAVGLVGALLAGAFAMSSGLTGIDTAVAGNDSVKPRVRTIERTVTVHKPARHSAAPQVVYTTGVAATTAGSSVSGSDDVYDDQYEDTEDEFDSEDEFDGYDDHGGQDDHESDDDDQGEHEDD